MIEELVRRAAAVPARQLHLVGAGLVLVAGAALWSYGLRAPLAELRAVRAEQARFDSAAGDPRALAAQLSALGADAGRLDARLGAVRGRDAAQQLVELVGDIGALARTHGVTLHVATPAPEEQVLAFVQTAVDADVSGSYATLLAWMAAVERARPNLAIAGFDMQASKAPGQVDMKIRIAAYRPQEAPR